MKHRARVIGGLLIAAALVGIGVYPVRKGLTVRYSPSKRRRPKHKRRRNRARWLLFWW